MTAFQRFFVLLVFFASTAASAKSGAYVVPYEDFGPQVIASDLVGMDWWQWQAHGDSRPRRYDIKVVVYRGLALDHVQARYPVIPEKNKDYRYVEYAAALEYLDQKINEDVLPQTTAKLKSTKRKIIRVLGKR
jgi:hypothetical protein